VSQDVLTPGPVREVEVRVVEGRVVSTPRQRVSRLAHLMEATGEAVQAVARVLHRTRGVPVQRTARILAIVPAHDEERDIARTLDALLGQTRKIDKIVVMLDNCTDATEEIVDRYKGVTKLKTIGNTDKKVGALSQAWQKFGHLGYDFVLGVDADTVCERNMVAELEREMVRNPRAGGVSARYTLNEQLADNGWGRLLIRAQRHDFASWLMDLMAKDRKTYVLGGQATLFRTQSLAEVVANGDRNAPWDPDSQVEDMELTWRLHELGKLTLVSPTARAYAGPMLTGKALVGQRRKWDQGVIQLLLRYGFSKSTWIPWKQQAALATDAVVRVLFVFLLAAATAAHQYVWSWIWVVPPILAIMLNVKMAVRVPHRKPIDIVYALAYVPAEAWLWFRIWSMAASWVNVLAGRRRDGWAAQKAAEAGNGTGFGWIVGAIVGATLVASTSTYGWLHASPAVQERFLTTGWALLAVLTVVRTLAVVVKLLKPSKGYRP
jgi:cellulose synthase/poly-beta-1,6-N-acetylglucosamine synthase-like glycosyltransferase